MEECNFCVVIGMSVTVIGRISLRNVPRKVNRKILIEIDGIMELTEGMVCVEQCWLRKKRDSVNQMNEIKVLSRNTRNEKNFVAFTNLDKAYDKIDREALSNDLKIYCGSG